MMSRRIAIACAVASAAASSTQLHAGILKNWLAPLGGEFSTPSLWSPGSVPVSSDIARFDLSGAYTVNFSGNRGVSRFIVGDDKLVLDLNGHNLVLKASGVPGVVMGTRQAEVSRVSIRGGTLKAGTSSIGHAAGAKANVTLSGDAAWQNSGLLAVGSGGAGGVTVIRGASLSSNTAEIGAAQGANGVVTLSGEGSSWQVADSLVVGGDLTPSALKKRKPKAVKGGKASDPGTGLLNVRYGADLDVGGLVEVRKGGTLRLEGGDVQADDLLNRGKVLFSAGGLVADILNAANGVITVNGNLVLPGDVDQLGTIACLGGRSIQFDGDVVGPGAMEGGGLFRFGALYDLGDSPASVGIEGDVEFSEAGALVLDLMPAAQDALSVSRSLALNDVQVNLAPGLEVDRVYSLIDARDIVLNGTVSVSGNYEYELVSSSDALGIRIISVVPEPGTFLVGAVLPLLALRRRPRT